MRKSEIEMINKGVNLQAYLGGSSVTIKHHANCSYCELNVAKLQIDETVWAMLRDTHHVITANEGYLKIRIFETCED